MAAYAADGQTVALAAEPGVHRDTVARVLSEAGVLRSPVKLDAAQVEQAVQLRAEGWWYRQITERFGVSTETVRRAVLLRLGESG